MAEGYHASVPFGYLPRARFRASPFLADFVQRQMPWLELSVEACLAGE